MLLIEKIKEKYHNDYHNVNRMMYTENKQQKFGLDSNDIPRNHMMDTISNEQGAEILGLKNNPDLQYPFEAVNRNLMTHTISNEQAIKLSNGEDIKFDHSKPRNKLLDMIPNEGFQNYSKTSKCLKTVNSDRLL